MRAERATRRRTPRRLVHLTEDQSGLLEHARLHHLETEVGALTGALANTSEHRHATVLGGDAVDHLGDEHGLADARTTKQADLAARHIRGEQVDDLDAGLEHAGLGLEGVEGRCRAVDVPALHLVEAVRVLVEGLAPDVPHVAEHLVADRHGDTASGVMHRGAAYEAVGRPQANGADSSVAELLGDLGDDGDGLAIDGDVEGDRVVELGERTAGELNVDHRSGDGDDAAGGQFGLGVGHVSCLRAVLGSGLR